MAFVKFTETGKSFAARVSISPRGMLSFNDAARRKFEMDKYAFCVLYYDKDRGLIGVEFINDENAEGAIKLRIRNTGADVAAKSFTDCFEIAPSSTSMYEISKGEQDNWVLIDLKTARERKSKQDGEDDLSDIA